MDNAKLMERTAKDLRSVLLSAPRGVPLRLLLSDFKMVVGSELPYRQLGFQKLEDLLKNLPSVVRLGNGATGELTCFAIADSTTSQLARFIATQKKPKLKKSSAPPMVNRPMYTGFTKKSKFGPRARPSPRGGGGGSGRFPSSGPGHLYVGPPARQNKPAYGKGYKGYTKFKANQYPGNNYYVNRPPSGDNLKSPPTHNSPSQGFATKSNYLANNGQASNSKLLNVTNVPSSSSSSSDKISSKIGGSVKGHSPPPKIHFSRLADSRDSNMPRARHMSMKDLEEWSQAGGGGEGSKLFMVCVDGYTARESILDQPTQTIKYLLYSSLDRGKKGVLPAVMLFFKKEAWDVDNKSLNFHHIPVGSRLRVYGQAICQKNKMKRIYEPAIKVHHYQYDPPNFGTKIGSSSPPCSPVVSSSSSPNPALSSSATGPPPPNIDRLIYELFKEKPGGIWGRRLGNEFKILHKLEPPVDILEIALSLPFVCREDVTEDNPILMLDINRTDIPAKLESQKVSFTTEKPSLPATVEFASSDYCDVFVTYINNPISFYLHRVSKDCSELQAMTESMSRELSKSKVKPLLDVKENQLYGYLWESVGGGGEGDMWCRVLTSKVSKKTAHIYFPDYGNSEQVPLKDLVELPREYYQLPFQAVHCCLHGCAGVGDEATELFIEQALEKTCVAQIMDNSGTRVAVELIDSESSSGDTTINSIIMSALHPIPTLIPTLPKPGEQRVPVSLTDIDEDGVVTVQLHGPGQNRLQQLMTLINEKYKKVLAADFVHHSVEEGKVYCTQFSADKKYYRVVVKKGIPNKLLVEYLDYGNEEETEIRRLRKPLDDPLFQLPPQAVKCRLHGIPSYEDKDVSECVTYFVASYLDCEDLYLTTVLAGGDGSKLPSVKLTIAGEGDEDDTILNDLILQQDFENNSISEDDPILYSPLSQPNSAGIASADSSLSRPNSEAFPPFVFASGVGGGGSTSLKSSTPVENGGGGGGGVELDSSHVPFVSRDFNFVPSTTSALRNDLGKSAAATISTPATPSSVSASTSARRTPPSTSSSIEASSHISGLLAGSLVLSDVKLMPPLVPTTPSGSPATTTSSGGAEERSSPSSSSAPSSMGGLVPRTPLSSPPNSSTSPLLSPPRDPSGPALGEEGEEGGGEEEEGVLVGLSTVGTAGGLLGENEVACNRPELSFEAFASSEPQAVLVVWVESPHNFVVQFLNNFDDLNGMMDQLNNSVSTFPSLWLEDVSRGHICCAPSCLDQRWYRVSLLSTASKGTSKVSVKFLDYGSTEEVAVSSLKSLPAKFLALPIQAIPCSLKGLQPLSEEPSVGSGAMTWSEEAKSWFQERVLEKTFFAVEMGRDGTTSSITLLDTSGIQTIDLRADMKEAGLAHFHINV